MSTTHTPGYNTRIAIWFDTDKNGRKVAYRWSSMGRAIRMGLAEAQNLVATETADLLSGHPMR